MTTKETLKKYFGYDSFREGQEEVINKILKGRDVLAIMPTGAGKSLCYEIPALMMDGITIIISPLISLMQDQVTALKDLGITATYINSSLSDFEIGNVLNDIKNDKYKIVYVAPERLESQSFIDFMANIKIAMVTVDEAHCISQWGQDFRPSYLKITSFINGLNKRPILSAFTATANQEVKDDMLCMLRLENPYVIVTGFDRKNLYYSVEKLNVKGKNEYIVNYIKEHPNDSGIIYCATRNNVDEVCELLKTFNVRVTKYHAGLSNEERKKNQEDFTYYIEKLVGTDKLRILDVGIGQIPYSSILLAHDNMGEIDTMDKFTISNKSISNLNCNPHDEYFGSKTSVHDYDLVVANRACSAIEHIVANCVAQKRPYLIKLCACNAPDGTIESWEDYLRAIDPQISYAQDDYAYDLDL